MTNFPKFAIEQLQESRNPVAAEILIAIDSATSKGGTMRKWFEERHDITVDTIQVDKKNKSLWCPLNRRVDSKSYKTKVLLNDSVRDYSGMKVVSISENCLIVENDWHIIAYTHSLNTKD